MTRNNKEDLYRRLKLFLFAVILFIPLTSSCTVEIAPTTSIATLNDENITVTCKATECGHHLFGLLVKQIEGSEQPNDTGILPICTDLRQTSEGTSYSYERNCSGIINVNDSGFFIVCYAQINGSKDIWSSKVELLVQDNIENVTGLTVRRFGNNQLNISWTPVYAYDGLNVFYNISVNETTDIVQLATWFTHDLENLDPCEDFVNISITPFINTTDNYLMGTTIYWDDIPTDAPPNNTILSYTVVMTKNGFVHMNVLIDSCDCPAIPSNNLTLKNDTYSFSVTVPVVSNNTCSSTASVALSLYMNLEVDIVLHNIVGSTKQNETILIDTNPLVSFTFINGTPGVLTVRCNFINHVITMNEYAAGCMVFYTDMNEPVQSIPRNNNESTVTMNITNISSTGYYDFFVLVLPAPVRSAYSEYISVKPNPSTSTAHHSSSCHSSNSTSITPTPTHTTSFSPSASISSSPSCTPNKHKFLSDYIGVTIIDVLILVLAIIIALVIGVIIGCCARPCVHRRNDRGKSGAESKSLDIVENAQNDATYPTESNNANHIQNGSTHPIVLPIPKDIHHIQVTADIHVGSAATDSGSPAGNSPQSKVDNENGKPVRPTQANLDHDKKVLVVHSTHNISHAKSDDKTDNIDISPIDVNRPIEAPDAVNSLSQQADSDSHYEHHGMDELPNSVYAMKDEQASDKPPANKGQESTD